VCLWRAPVTSSGTARQPLTGSLVRSRNAALVRDDLAGDATETGYPLA
jgi:hypothetical protein